jgi:RNA polymerase sigma-70 factor (ECF subfamily)
MSASYRVCASERQSVNHTRTKSGDHDAGRPAGEHALDEMPPTGQPADHDFLAEVREHRSRLVRLAYRFCWNRANAEDAVHSALIRAAGRRAQVRDGARVWAWVRAIVVRECQDQRRREKRDRRAADARIQKEGQPGDAANPAELAARGELTERVREAIGELPERQQTAVVLRHLEEMSYAEIAEIMDVSESTVRVQVRNALENLRAKLSKKTEPRL